MNRRSRELETLLLSMFAAVPLYFTYAISMLALVLFHGFMLLVVVRAAAKRGTELSPASLVRRHPDVRVTVTEEVTQLPEPTLR